MGSPVLRDLLNKSYTTPVFGIVLISRDTEAWKIYLHKPDGELQGLRGCECHIDAYMDIYINHMDYLHGEDIQ